MSLFLNLLSELQNPEKTRNFNVFKNYSLDEFQSQIERYGKLLEFDPSYQPFRFAVIGTNGKGSTSYYLSELLQKVKLDQNIGLYTSPHLLSPFERIICNGKMISEIESDEIITQLERIDATQLKALSYFECMTLLCFCFFKKMGCSFEVWEAGLGGRLDATKLANPDVIILTKIGIDHSEILGDTLERIAFEKLHIAGNNSKVIYSFPVTGKLRSEIVSIAKSLRLEVHFFDENNYPDYLQYNFNFVKWVLEDLRILDPSLLPSFETLKRPPGRLETIRETPLLVFDPAHNPDAVKHTIATLRKSPEWQNKPSLLCGCLPDKDTDSIWKEISAEAWQEIFFYEAEGFYKWSDALPSTTGKFLHSEQELKEALDAEAGPVLALGSFRLYPVLTSLYQNRVIL